MLEIHITNQRQNVQIDHPGGPLEFGRGPQNELERFVIDDVFVSRDQLRIEEQFSGKVRVENLSLKKEIELEEGGTLGVAVGRDFPLPLRLTVGKTLIEINKSEGDSFDKELLKTISQPIRSDHASALRSLTDLKEALAPETIMRWLETVISLQRSAVGAADFLQQIVRAMINLVGLDVAVVLFRRGENWEPAAREATAKGEETGFSRTLLRHVAAEQRTFYGDLTSLKMHTVSLRDLDAVVVSPIFGVQDEVMGVLYGVRKRNIRSMGSEIKPIEAQMVQLLAAAVGGNQARVVASRTRVQFEQFFSPELVRELERDPALLEGRDQEVTILVSDLRKFSSLSERLGPQKTCKLMRDMMERLSTRIMEHGGVIVDYAGDGILAMWNAPVKQPDHAVLACRAALAMQGELPDLSDRWREVVGEPLALGIGLNTGTAQVGNTGSSRKFKYGPHGHTVNLASRVQDATKKLGLPILITGSTRDRVPDSFVTRRLCQVRVAGIQGPVTLHELHGESASPEWLARRESYESALSLFEAQEWPKACQALIPLLDQAARKDRFDTPTLKLMRRAWECLETPPDNFDPVLNLAGT